MNEVQAIGGIVAADGRLPPGAMLPSVALRWTAVALFALGGMAHARGNDFPTVDRVEFVMECMYRHEGKQEFLYKCSCVIDAIAREMKYDDYVAASSGSRYRDMGGERMGVFRDPPNVSSAVRKYQATLKKANGQCGIPERGK